jgi:hypothetical protein
MTTSKPAPTEIPSLDLFGWDTTFVISLTRANEAIKARKSSPTTFELTETSRSGAVTAAIKGTWGDWSLTPKGDGQNIVLLCPITSGSFTSLLDPDTSFDLSKTSVEMEFKLAYQQQPQITSPDSTAKPGTGVQHNLLLRTETKDPNDPVVSLEASSYQFPNANSPDEAKALCDGIFTSWFKQHLDEFKHVFSIFLVNQTADKGAFQWLKPTGTPGYAIASTGDPDTSVLAVMAMTENRPVPSVHAVDPRILRLAGKHAAFVISGPRFVEKWLLQGLLTMRLGTSKDDYDPSNDGLSWQNKAKIQWATFPDKNNQPVAAWIDKGNFRLSLERDEIVFSFTDLTWLADDGLTAHVNYTDFLSLSLKSGTDNQGKPYKNVVTLERAAGRTPALAMTTTVSEARTIASLVTNVVLSLIGAIAGGLTGGLFDAAAEGVGEALSTGLEAAEEGGADVITIDVSDVLGDVLSKTDSGQLVEEADAALDESVADLNDAEEGAQQGEAPATIGAKIVGKLQTFGRNILSNKWKLIGGMIGGVLGAGLGSVPMILTALEQAHFSDVPNLEEFAANCVESVHWPDAGGFALTSAALSGAAVLGGDLVPVTSSLLAARVPVAVAVPVAPASAAFATTSSGSDDTADDDASADGAEASDESDDDA